MESGERRSLVALYAIVALVAPVLGGCGRPSATTGSRMVVAASIAPLADFARKVGGERVSVTLLVPPGSNPHTYQIQPDQMAALSKASVLILNGAGLEFWAKDAIDAADNPKLLVVNTSQGLKLLDHSETGEGANPHVWLDPIYAIHQVGAIRDAFTKADPLHARYYASNAARYIRRLRQLDSDVRAQVSHFRSKNFVSFHPTWVYFARRYGLREAAVIEQSPGKEPSPESIRHAIDTARRIGAKAIFTEPQMSTKAAQVVAEEAGAKVVLLNAFGEPPDYGYTRMMRKNLRGMAEALM